MQFPFSIQTIAALAEVVTGGSAGDASPSIGHYRTGPKLERFFGALNIQLDIGNGSRVPAVHALLDQKNRSSGGKETITRVIEATADPRDYFDHPDKLVAVVEYLNKRLRFDGYELQLHGKLYRLMPTGGNTTAVVALTDKAVVLDLHSVQADFERALRQADSDPAGAITAACSTIESVCKCILDKMNVPLPNDKDVRSLAKTVGKQLDLDPGRDNLPKEWVEDIRMVLSGLQTVVGGVGSLRTHAGDAHGKGLNAFPADSRIAKLAIHSASTISLFYLETWQRIESKKTKHPSVSIPRNSIPNLVDLL